MTLSSYQLAVVVALTVVAGLMMISTGMSRKLLGWKSRLRRCPSCGRMPRWDCPCRR